MNITSMVRTMKPYVFMFALGLSLPILLAATSGCTPAKPVNSAAEAQRLHQLAVKHVTDGNLDYAVRLLDLAIEMRTSLVEQDGRIELEDELAMSYANRGDAFHRQRKLEAAILDFEKAIQIRTRLVHEEGRGELSADLVKSLTVRAIAYQQTGNQEKAIDDMEQALLLVKDARLKQAIEDMLRENRGR